MPFSIHFLLNPLRADAVITREAKIAPQEMPIKKVCKDGITAITCTP
jgi:hypothetical protein